MKFIFIDAENIGLKEITKIPTSLNDRVFVFSKNQTIKKLCEQKLYTCIDDYSVGANQADFRVISLLSRIFILHMQDRPSPSITFDLHSNDKALGQAFINECNIHNFEGRVITSKPPTTPSKTDAEILFAALKRPSPLDEALRESLGFSKQRFTQAQNELIQNELIIRCTSNKKSWRQNK